MNGLSNMNLSNIEQRSMSSDPPATFSKGYSDPVYRVDFVTDYPHFILNNGDKVVFPFSPPIYQTTVDQDFCDLLLNEGRKLDIKNDDMNFKLAGNLKFGRSYRYKKEFQGHVENYIIDKAHTFVTVQNEIFNHDLPEKQDMFLDDMWINFTHQFDFNPPHIHKEMLSFIIYCKVPQEIFQVQADSLSQNAGKVVFEYGEAISQFVDTEYPVQPYENLMFIFPAKLRHYVSSFWVDEERISVSGNIGFPQY